MADAKIRIKVTGLDKARRNRKRQEQRDGGDGGGGRRGGGGRVGVGRSLTKRGGGGSALKRKEAAQLRRRVSKLDRAVFSPGAAARGAASARAGAAVAGRAGLARAAGAVAGVAIAGKLLNDFQPLIERGVALALPKQVSDILNSGNRLILAAFRTIVEEVTAAKTAATRTSEATIGGAQLAQFNTREQALSLKEVQRIGDRELRIAQSQERLKAYVGRAHAKFRMDAGEEAISQVAGDFVTKLKAALEDVDILQLFAAKMKKMLGGR